MWLAPRVDRTLGVRAMQISALVMAASFILPGLAGGIAAFTAAMLIASGASMTMDVVMNTRVSQVEARIGRSLMNLNHGIFSLVYACAALCAGLFREAGFGPLTVFSIMACLTGVMVFGMRSAQAPHSKDDPVQRIEQHALALIGGAIILIAFLAEQSTEAWSALLLERELGGSPAQGALGPAILGLTMGIGRISGQLVLTRFSETRVIQVAALIAALGLFIAANADGLVQAYLGFAILGTGVSVTAPMAYSAIGKRVSDAQRTVMITRVSIIGYMGFFIGPPLMGGLSEAFGLHVSFLAVSAILLIAAAVLAPALRRQPVA